jgi:hypothetical protein
MPVIDSNLKSQINSIFFIVFADKYFVYWNSTFNSKHHAWGKLLHLLCKVSHDKGGSSFCTSKSNASADAENKSDFYMGLSLMSARSLH